MDVLSAVIKLPNRMNLMGIIESDPVDSIPMNIFDFSISRAQYAFLRIIFISLSKSFIHHEHWTSVYVYFFK